MQKSSLFFILLISITPCFYSQAQYYIQKPGNPAPLVTRTASPLPISQYSNIEIVDNDVLAQERFQRLKTIELEGRIPYQETRKTIITPTSGSTSNQ